MARTALLFPGLIVLTLAVACNGGSGGGDGETDVAEDRSAHGGTTHGLALGHSSMHVQLV